MKEQNGEKENVRKRMNEKEREREREREKDRERDMKIKRESERAREREKERASLALLKLLLCVRLKRVFLKLYMCFMCTHQRKVCLLCVNVVHIYELESMFAGLLE